MTTTHEPVRREPVQRDDAPIEPLSAEEWVKAGPSTLGEGVAAE